MAINEKRNVRKLVTFRREQMKRIENFRDEQALKSKDAAVRDLVDIGLRHAPPPKRK